MGVCDSDGEVKGQESTLFAIFEFISALSESSFSKRLLPPILPELVYHLIGYMQITKEQVCVCGWVGGCVCVCVRGNQLYSDPSQMCVWSDDINRFVEDDENEFSYSGKYIILPLVFL